METDDDHSALFARVRAEERARVVRRLYAMVLSSRPHRLRFQLYEAVEGELRTIWPEDAHLATRARLWPGQRFSLREGLPAFHFSIENPPLGWAPEMGRGLSAFLGYACTVTVLDGERLVST
jgi:hypothetical protein